MLHSRRPPAAPSNPAPPVAAGHASAEPVDLSSLPPIESIDAATDITAFLRKGIPQELRHAALRRAWSADPAIRDFVGLAENAWDFNDPNAMPGFGPLDCSEAEVSALVDRDRRRLCGRLPKVSPIRSLKPKIVRRWLLQRGWMTGHKR